ncbi:hypothetical protein ACFQ3W_15150 [Paenibacillus puldeungensis]|uniref:Uncharacterized protein n=1 Tax=Paenibacillus puldeungensis TaxID=696536 RepID=A0ABW3RZG7_9BACL
MKKRMLSTLLAAVLLTASIGTASAAGTGKVISQLPKPVWSQPKAAGDLGRVQESPHEVSSLNTVYLHTKEKHATTKTKLWLVDTLKSYDMQTGKLKWSVNFADPGTAMDRESKPYLVGPDGTVYVTFVGNSSPNSTQIYAVGPDGKRKWKVNLSKRDGDLFLLDNGNLVFASTGAWDKDSNFIGGTITLLNKNGSKLKTIPYKGTVLAAGNRVLIQTNYKTGKGSRLEALDSSLKRVFAYQFPAGSYAEVDYDYVLNDGSVVARTNLEKTGNRLIGFSPSGKLLWGRDIAGNALVARLGSKYGVYENNKLSLYTTKNFLKTATIKDHSEFDISLSKLPDGNLDLNFVGSSEYILNPSTLEAEYTFKFGEDVMFSYVGNGVGYIITDHGVSRYKF